MVYRAFNERSGGRFGQPQGGRVGHAGDVDRDELALPFAVDTPAEMYSLWYQRYMHTYGVTNEDFARYSVIARANAATNPAAWFYKRPITIDDHQTSRWIVEPILRLLDCCQESDGGVAMIVTSAERARPMAESRGPDPAAARATPTAARSTTTLRSRPRRVSRGEGARASSCTAIAGITPTTSTWR